MKMDKNFGSRILLSILRIPRVLKFHPLKAPFSADKGICNVVLINAAIIVSVGLLLVFIWLFLNGRK